jgi:hypothetical protein
VDRKRRARGRTDGNVGKLGCLDWHGYAPDVGISSAYCTSHTQGVSNEH